MTTTTNKFQIAEVAGQIFVQVNRQPTESEQPFAHMFSEWGTGNAAGPFASVAAAEAWIASAHLDPLNTALFPLKFITR